MTISLANDLPSFEQLPDTFAILLDQFSSISLTGDEQSKYLQGQVTCDVNSSNEHTFLHGAHCDAKGKVFSIFRFINRDNAHLLLQPKCTVPASLKELKKFGVFAKVDIEEVTDLGYYALVGDQATTLIQQKFQQVPDSLTPVLSVGTTTLVYIAGQKSRYLFIDNKNNIESLALEFSLITYSNNVWDLLEIIDGFPILNAASISEYVPQMLNLQAIHGISFTKGCYLGQETVARMQYLGKNKRALFYLSAKQPTKISDDDIIEKQLGENWRKAGSILATYQADDSTAYIQAVLASDLEENTHLRIKEQQSPIIVKSLPYSLK
ncbi:MAG: folate-binding protein YgfZ [Alteromonadaceae bacterium]|jgi:folate-binding protein YgfZ